MKRVFCLLLCVMLCLPLIVHSEEYTLKKGSQGTSVTRLQRQLTSLKLFSGAVDGKYGNMTETAVKRAQRALAAAGLEIEETGIADPYTLECIYDEQYRSVLMTLRVGSTGNRVRELQQRLIDLNILQGTADGDFGEKTRLAVLDFQQRMAALGVDLGSSGEASPELLAILQGDLTQYGFISPESYNEADPGALTAEEIYAPACIVIDGPSGKVLFEKNADDRMYPASTTKIMTLLLALECGNLDSVVTIPECAADVPKDSSLVPVRPGETMTMRDLLYGLMIRSGNDAANAAAELCGGSIEAFVARMNAKAAELGMTGTHFMNPHGYHDENHYTTARDLAKLTRAGLTDADFCRIVTCLEYTLPATERRKPLTIKCTHEIFREKSKYYIPYAAGVKSGTTSQAGFCYVGAYQKDGHTTIAVVLGETKRTRAWTDLKKLFACGMAQY